MPIYPPRPKGAIPRTQLNYLESTGLWIAQYKYQGSRCLIHIEPNSNITMWSRHGAKHRSYELTTSVHQQLANLPGLETNKEYWLDGELLIKTTPKDTKGKIVLFDVLQAGRYLIGCDQMTRLDILDNICGKPRELDSLRQMAYVITPDVWMAPFFTGGFDNLFDEDHGVEVEGILLRKIKSTLDNYGHKEYNIDWMVRCRRPSKLAPF